MIAIHLSRFVLFIAGLQMRRKRTQKKTATVIGAVFFLHQRIRTRRKNRNKAGYPFRLGCGRCNSRIEDAVPDDLLCVQTFH